MKNNNQTKEDEKFDALKYFFDVDMKIKEKLIDIIPTEMDDFDEESRIECVDKLYDSLEDFEFYFTKITEKFEMSQEIKDSIKKYFDKARQNFLIKQYKPGMLKKIALEQFGDMDMKFVEEVKEKCFGYGMGIDFGEIASHAKSVNELLHLMHSYITNNDEILQAMPILDVKKNKNNEEITLYGEQSEIAKQIFDAISPELDVGYTDIISMQDRILMMVRDRGHALTINIDTKEEDALIKYFVPKVCNEVKVKLLPGMNKNYITGNGARGLIVANKEDVAETLVDFIERVPTDMDMFRSSVVSIPIKKNPEMGMDFDYTLYVPTTVRPDSNVLLSFSEKFDDRLEQVAKNSGRPIILSNIEEDKIEQYQKIIKNSYNILKVTGIIESNKIEKVDIDKYSDKYGKTEKISELFPESINEIFQEQDIAFAELTKKALGDETTYSETKRAVDEILQRIYSKPKGEQQLEEQ